MFLKTVKNSLKAPVPGSPFNKFAGWRLQVEDWKLRCRCFPVNFNKILLKHPFYRTSLDDCSLKFYFLFILAFKRGVLSEDCGDSDAVIIHTIVNQS